ncbi:MAG: hypothetical protein KJZ90_01245 [Rhodocyclaceae bacterium]|jgi:hypothetical protein|nr:hypothetical protein [Rhodocyclaceae bacterium]
MPAKPTKTNIIPSLRKAWAVFLDSVGAKPFRRSAVSKVVYPHTNPRSLPRADALADALIQASAKAGELVRHGHLHWMRAQKGRILKSGRKVAELADTVELKLDTHCPEKWLAVDLETGDVWVGGRKGWGRANKDQRAEAAGVLKRPKGK